MEKYIILPDITCDMSNELREYFKLDDYVKGYVHINDESMRTSLDWDEISREKFYKILASKSNKVSSAAASPEEYYLKFKEYVDKGYAVLSMSISSKISATFNIASTAAARVMEENPCAKIYCFDSLRMSGSFGLLVAYACEMKENGASFDEVVEWLESNKCKVHQMGPIDDLTYVARRGQISKGKAFMGNLIGIKPMGDCNESGYVSVLAKVKGIKKALPATVGYVKRIATNLEDQYIIITHSNREEYAMTLKGLIESELRCKKVFVCDVFAGCGTNIGAGMICVNFMGESVTADSENEKQALADAIAEISNK